MLLQLNIIVVQHKVVSNKSIYWNIINLQQALYIIYAMYNNVITDGLLCFN